LNAACTVVVAAYLADAILAGERGEVAHYLVRIERRPHAAHHVGDEELPLAVTYAQRERIVSAAARVAKREDCTAKRR
jgi:hypothetical protein